ncbi:LysR family transcriptional regulator [Salinactinospora qingdaonensis]|uniref:LysR family transcriptional regulator n=1 Tax=Salinactinospora qingdaonensis TaxID=702744 RepID=A0ABP7FW23_9ACTN
MELRHLQTFRAVARTMSFTHAAEELHYAQSSVTGHIQALEAELGTALFDRSKRDLSLTSAGQRLIDYADRVLLLVQEARAAVDEGTGEPEGELAIGGLETLCAQRIPALLSHYRSLCPRVRVTVKEGNRGEVYNAVRRSDIAVGFTFGDPPADETLASETIATDHLMVVVPRHSRLARLDRVRPQDLQGESFLATEPGCCFREMLDSCVHSLGPTAPTIEAQMTSFAALCSCAATGMGAALLPDMAVRSHVDKGRIVALPMAGDEFRVQVTMTWLRHAETTPGIATMLKAARSVFTSGGHDTPG